MFVSSAGNDGQCSDGGVAVAPAAAENTINVRVVDRSFYEVAYFSTFRTAAGDPLARTADGGWNSAEHLYFQLTDPGQEGYYYFRVFNLSPHTDEFSLASLVTPIPEPSSLLLAALAMSAVALRTFGRALVKRARRSEFE